MMIENIGMMATVCDALDASPVAHLVYISSDAVYADRPVPLTETSPAAPAACMARCILRASRCCIAAAGSVPLAILRPTLIYGAGDPHNGYGPNRFRRQANRGEDIVLFGEGEERRDHVDVDDIGRTGSTAFSRTARPACSISRPATLPASRHWPSGSSLCRPRKVAIKGSPRQGPMPHNGYRPFDRSGDAMPPFPTSRYTTLDAGLARAQRAGVRLMAASRSAARAAQDQAQHPEARRSEGPRRHRDRQAIWRNVLGRAARIRLRRLSR